MWSLQGTLNTQIPNVGLSDFGSSSIYFCSQCGACADAQPVLEQWQVLLPPWGFPSAPEHVGIGEHREL